MKQALIIIIYGILGFTFVIPFAVVACLFALWHWKGSIIVDSVDKFIEALEIIIESKND